MHDDPLIEAAEAMKELVVPLKAVAEGFEVERRRRKWAVRVLGVAVACLVVAVLLVAKDNAQYRAHRCEQSNDTRASIRVGFQHAFIALAPNPTVAQKAAFAAVNDELARALPPLEC